MPYFANGSGGCVYLCPNCRAWYQEGHLQCAVKHSPGSCCHYGETRLQRDPDGHGHSDERGRK